MSSKNQGRVVGIDLGTTQSVVAYLDPAGVPQTISNKDGDPLTPSAIYLDEPNAIVGKSALQAIKLSPDRVATLVKRDMGEHLYRRELNGRNYRPATLSAIILRKLVQDAERRIGPISAAVITVPAFFDETRRKATADAGRIAGLEVLDIINEPTAAAIAYTFEGRLRDGDGNSYFRGGEETALVYDLGGGTFDVTLVRLSANRFQAIAGDGVVRLGGSDWDDRIIDHIGIEFEKLHGFNPLLQDENGSPNLARLQVADKAEAAKQLLTDLPMAPLEFSHNDKQLRTTLTREQFQQMTSVHLQQTKLLTNRARESAKLDWKDINRVLLVGGSTRMPMVREMLRSLCGTEPDDRLDPDQVVARGAAIYAAIRASNDSRIQPELSEHLVQRLQGVQITNVSPHGLGLRTFSKRTGQVRYDKLIPKDTELPFSNSKLYPIGIHGIRSLEIPVLEGDAPTVDGCILIGYCTFPDLPDDLTAEDKVQVQLRYEENGRVTVTAVEPSRGITAQAVIRRESSLSEEDIEREAHFVQKVLKIQ